MSISQECVEYWIRFEWNKHRCTYVNFVEIILVDVVTLLYKDEMIWNGNYSSLYTNATIDMRRLSDVFTRKEYFLSLCEAVIASYSWVNLSNLSNSSNWTKISSFSKKQDCLLLFVTLLLAWLSNDSEEQNHHFILRYKHPIMIITCHLWSIFSLSP